MKIKLPLGALFKAGNELIGKKENEHYVNFLFPNLDVGGKAFNFIVKYILQAHVSHFAGNFSNEVASLYNILVKKLYGGIPLNGKIIIHADKIEFKPTLGQTFFIKGYEKVIVPKEDITSVAITEGWAGLKEYVVVTTINGAFKLQVSPSSLGSTTGEDICDQLNKLMRSE